MGLFLVRRAADGLTIRGVPARLSRTFNIPLGKDLLDMTKDSITELEHLSEAEMRTLLDPDLLPRHIAIIMDGNGRWAAQRGLPRMAGHTEGIKSVKEMITLCRDLGIRALTIYAFSQENWKRPAPEITALMMLLERYLQMELEALVEKGARFRAIGRVTSLPESALAWVRKVERETAHLDKLNLTVALKLMPVTGVTLPFVSYGGSSLLASFLAAGLLLNVGQHRPVVMANNSFEFE